MDGEKTDHNVLLDQKALDNIRALQRPGGPNPLVKYIDLFLQYSPALLDTLRTAAAAGDVDNTIRPAHSLKSDSANLGATTLSILCKQLEELCRIGKQTEATALIADIELEYEKVCASLMIERERAA